MISCAALERPGWWRVAGIVVGLLVAFSPSLLLAVTEARGASELLGTGFGWALIRSLAVALAVAAICFCIGLPAGVAGALFDFPLRKSLLAVIAVPMLAPSFLWAIGLSMLSTTAGSQIFHGSWATIYVFAALALPLVIFASFASARTISQSQADAVRLAGGESRLFAYALRSVWPATALTALLAGVLTLSDPGPGQIFGFPNAASEILVSFSAQYDFGLATRQCLGLAGVVIAITLPLAILLSNKLATPLLARDIIPFARSCRPASQWLGPLTFGTIVFAAVVLPTTGLLMPLARNFPLERALRELSRTGFSTVIYAAIAVTVAVTLGSLLAACAGRDKRLRTVVFVSSIVLVTLPPAFGALGFIHVATAAPPALDLLLRSRFPVGFNAGIRCLPIVAIFVMRSLGTTSPSWANVAAAHGIRLPIYFRRVLLPWIIPSLLLAGMLSALISTADVTSALLLHPPGEGSFPLAIFTVMANAPESLTAALCLLYFAVALAVVIVAAITTNLVRRKT
jgi:ABC-type spermidine/putrescine transport system permease subunit II